MNIHCIYVIDNQLFIKMQRIYVYVKYNPEWQNLKFKSTNNKNK